MVFGLVLLAGCAKENECDSKPAPEADGSEATAKALWGMGLNTPAAFGLNYTETVNHPMGFRPAVGLNNVPVTSDPVTGESVYTLRYVVSTGFPAGSDVWTLPIIYTGIGLTPVQIPVVNVSTVPPTPIIKDKPRVQDGK